MTVSAKSDNIAARTTSTVQQTLQSYVEKACNKSQLKCHFVILAQHGYVRHSQINTNTGC